jgi:hypothetical protein
MHPAFLSSAFIAACGDYARLMDRHYPERGVLKLVGDRYKLTGDQRTVLYRGISSRQRSLQRESLLVADITDKHLVIDGYNVLFTLLNYRLGRITFISTDQILRDAGSLHGKLRDQKIFEECAELMVGYLAERQPARSEVYFDAPVSHSEKHAQLLRGRMKDFGMEGDCFVIRSADWALRQATHGVLATSDTAIIEKAGLPVVDLPKEILTHTYAAVFPVLGDLIGQSE